MYFYLLAPLYAAGGFRFAALNVGATLINAAAAVLLLSVLRRRASRSLVIGVAVALLVYVARLSPMFVSAWNPHVLVLPMAAMLATAASWATDDLYLAPMAVVLGSFLVQIAHRTDAHRRVALQWRCGCQPACDQKADASSGLPSSSGGIVQPG